MKIGTFSNWTGARATLAVPATFNGITQDSRAVTPGCLYVAIRGERFDGHTFVRAALDAGAACALVDDAWRGTAADDALPLLRVADTRAALADAARAYRATLDAMIFGVTGSAGKTTTKELLAALLRAGGRVAATVGNLNNALGLPLSLLRTPDDVQFGVFECGTNHPGEIAALANVLRPQIAVITNIGTAHMEFFKTQEGIAREKGALFAALPAHGAAVACRETPHFDILKAMSAAPMIEVSFIDRDADYFAEVVDERRGTVHVSERTSGRMVELTSGLPGRHNAENVALAYAAARRAGILPERAQAAFANFSLPGFRWQVTHHAGVKVVNDAYNANPDSMAAALRTFMAEPCDGRRIVVLGDMLELGEQSDALHRATGACVAMLAPDMLIAVGRTGAAALVDGAVAAGFPAARVTMCATSEEAAVVVRGVATAGDAMLLKGSRGIGLERILELW